MVDLVRTNREQILRLARKHGVTRVRVFGSMARGDAGPQSDVDFLVEFETGKTPSLLGIGGMEIELSSLIGRKADLRTAEDLSRYFRDDVVRTAELQYAA